MNLSIKAAALSFAVLAGAFAAKDLLVLDEKMHHLRVGDGREWTHFDERAEGSELVLSFDAKANQSEQTLLVRQSDVKASWRVTLNGKPLGRLKANEDDLVFYFPLPKGTLRDGKNELRIAGGGRGRDDIRVGNVRIDPRSPAELLSSAAAHVEVIDADSGRPIPCRLTIIDSAGSLAAIGAKSDNHLAVRPGVVYTGDGKAEFGLAEGRYTLFAGRGFEYSLAQRAFEVTTGETFRCQLKIRREVPTPGMVSCDTHLHTLTFSGHGDASIGERMITIAGEGIELAVATDHNVNTDYEPFARKARTRQYFTPVIGNEVTTKVGHFNAFPIRPGTPPPDVKVASWAELLPGIKRTPGVKVVILNHPRNIHSGFQPFGLEHFNTVSGANLDGWQLDATGIEVVTSAALQSNLQWLYRDWFALLNRGIKVSPIGSSDTHDVNRYIVGQACTYIECPDDDPANIDVAAACKALNEGRVLVSMGLLARIQVNKRYGPGALLSTTGDLEVACQVHGPTWVTADHVALYSNGVKIREVNIPAPAETRDRVVKWSGSWKVPRLKQDSYLVVIATGPGPVEGYWRTGKPYQAKTNVWNPRVIGSTGAVWIDADDDGRHRSAREYAGQLVKRANDLPRLLALLADYDEAVSAQAAELWQTGGHSLLDAAVTEALAKARPHVQRGFISYIRAWRDSELARGTGE